MIEYPKKADGIEINEVDDGYVVFHPVLENVLYLNHTAALVLDICDGETKFDDMPKIVQEAFELEEPPVEDVKNCLGQLIEATLIS